MTEAERMIELFGRLPKRDQAEVTGLAESLAQRKSPNGSSPAEKVEILREWVSRQPVSTPVLADDTRQTIYED